LDAAIRAFKDYLADRSTESASAVTYAPSDNGANDAVPSEGMQHLHKPKMFNLQRNCYIHHSKENQQLSLMPICHAYL